MDPLEQMEKEEALDLINSERAAQGLTPLGTLEEAQAWKANPKAEASVVPPAALPENKETPPAEAKPTKVEAPMFPNAQASAQTQDQLLAKIAELERQVNGFRTEEGRVAKYDRLMKDAETRALEAEKRAEAAEAKAQALADKQADGNFLSLLSEEEKAVLGDNPDLVVAAIAKLTRQVAKSQITAPDLSEVQTLKQRIEERDRIDREREERSLAQRRSEMFSKFIAQVVPPEVYGVFGDNPKWMEFGQTMYYGKTNAEHYQQALNGADHESVIDLYQRFMRYAGIEVPAKANKPPLTVSASGVATAPSIQKDGPQKFDADEVRQKEDRFMKEGKLPAGWSEAAFQKWSREMDQARGEGRLVDKAGKPVYD